MSDAREEQGVWEVLQARLAAYHVEQGVDDITIEKAAEPPQLHPRRGRFQQVWTEVQHQVPVAPV